MSNLRPFFAENYLSESASYTKNLAHALVYAQNFIASFSIRTSNKENYVARDRTVFLFARCYVTSATFGIPSYSVINL